MFCAELYSLPCTPAGFEKEHSVSVTENIVETTAAWAHGGSWMIN